MISRIHSKLGTAGFIISIVALVAALGGGAYAANSALSGKQKKEVEKIAKKYAGKPGKNGAAGPAGATGPAGAAGAAGKEGPQGKEGTAGATGATGAAGANGTDGTTGFTETLPSGQTETGTFSVEPLEEEGTARVPVSFPIPLAASVNAHELNLDAPATAECPGSAEEPVATPGNLCIYETKASPTAEPQEYTVTGWQNPETGNTTLATTAKVGTILFLSDVVGPFHGDWAVTAP